MVDHGRILDWEVAEPRLPHEYGELRFDYLFIERVRLGIGLGDLRIQPIGEIRVVPVRLAFVVHRLEKRLGGSQRLAR